MGERKGERVRENGSNRNDGRIMRKNNGRGEGREIKKWYLMAGSSK